VTTTQNPAIGKSAEANGIRTNHLDAGEGARKGNDDVVLIHGSGPGVTSYANWRLVLPVWPRTFTWSPRTWSGSATPIVPTE
jgi:hypothetical protein